MQSRLTGEEPKVAIGVALCCRHWQIRIYTLKCVSTIKMAVSITSHSVFMGLLLPLLTLEWQLVGRKVWPSRPQLASNC